jgi:hypothetical protein
MPVFMVFPATSEVSITVGKGNRLAKSKQSGGQDYLQRIGTAHTRDDGSIWVQLMAIPSNGRLVIRPPQAGERIDPTLRTK